ncbi:MAG TPA: hypothetical protein DEE98_08520 [Elusimicrobia bacterium]|nr:MAG: hypothetical protein A2278_05110 [Elusimicrobia bacterium RIFOXYA12_FULL_49_49]OGS09271.1 MAG: hypothetical protein A2386_02455 [Elusimicrobia bacterium RIFOXYB1_FULL_48_9]OGS09292.1 MAG: hypothetical protein A2204_05230 [Elusimicrobia bacterium RIFOXYA1_FULL_47_7]OGS15210.1 MAG: hypothetical protein A2251_06840 [Elusimicrobia bacterium RIFOXYA2_FULL_47_53]OGS25935.1 MAG: hypothetical protein A2339_00965 [Elusimicrobia bacterium RIFOXYB12_FULL_50_12]OGS30261.1 MAG: hypothetical protein
MKKMIDSLFKDDFKDFIELLNKHRVDYCITGAYAVSFYSRPRATEDIDFYIAHTKDNSKRVAAAIKEFAGLDMEEGFFDTDKTVIIRLGLKPNQIELSNGLTGLTETEIMNHRVKDKYGEIAAYYIGVDELIKNKGIVKNLPHRKLRKGQDETDFEVLKAFKTRKMR